MRAKAPKIGAVLYLFWGLIHIAGGAAMLAASVEGTDAFLKLLSGHEDVTLAHESGGFGLLATAEVFGFHSFNIVWMGILVSIVSIRMNWKNSRAGYWFNMGIVALADLGLILFMVVPGVISISSAWVGPLLFVLALIFSTIGVKARMS